MFLNSFGDKLKNILYWEKKLFCWLNYSKILGIFAGKKPEEPVITNIGTFKRKTIDTFAEEISFYPNRKYLVVHLSDINPCTTILGVMKNNKLKDDDIIKLFSNMIRYLAEQPTRNVWFLRGKTSECRIYNVQGNCKVKHVEYSERKSKQCLSLSLLLINSLSKLETSKESTSLYNISKGSIKST